MAKSGYGSKNGSRKGNKKGGRGRNKTTDCRHPNTGNKK